MMGYDDNLRPGQADVGEKPCDTFVDNKCLQSQNQQPVPSQIFVGNGAKYFIEEENHKIFDCRYWQILVKNILIPEAPE